MKPRATYRLQFQKQFGFRDAARIAPYLAQLGISHVYASPWLKARPGSMHGYDIVDHHALNPELGSPEDFDAMVAAFGANGLRQILDFVPNHMGVGGADNPLWLDVLEWGADSAYAGWFDIEWRPGCGRLEDKLLAPFLGDQYGVELAGGKLELRFDGADGSFAVWAYGVHKLPVCPLDYCLILGDRNAALERIGDEFSSLRDWRPQVGRRAAELKTELARLALDDADVRGAMVAALAGFHGEPAENASWAKLDGLIERQHWRLASFRVAADDINYRRFFNINDLAGLRMELPLVFDHAHALVFELLDEGVLDGLRIDHIDGLLDPKGYLERLAGKPQYLVVEKILARHESLREDWPVDGTTGYEFANLALGVLMDPAGEEAMTKTYVEFTGLTEPFGTIVRECKRRVMRNEMASELDVLARLASGVARQNPSTADFTQNVLRRAIRQVVACFPVYRTYVDYEGVRTESDRRDIHWAVQHARTAEPDIDPTVFDFVENVLTGDLAAKERSGFSRHSVLHCAAKLQQFSGPVMAKGLEDTAFYRYNRCVALNEVGGSPDQFGISAAAFHEANAQRAKRWPHSMLSTSTHDTKRGEDARARLAVLAEIPQEWAAQAQAWSRLLRARSGDIESVAPPDRNEEYLFYQLLIGSWPAELTGLRRELTREEMETYTKRMQGAMTKSLREAGVHTTWTLPNNAYEDAVLSFVENALDPQRAGGFLSAFLPFEERVARLGMENSLTQTALKLTSPGVPDIYQGAELWELSLMDPDNRRPVDFEVRTAWLRHGRGEWRPLLEDWRNGAVKLFLTQRLLAMRAAEPDLFAEGDYEALAAEGPKQDCLVSFARCKGGKAVVVITARFAARRQANPGWDGTIIQLPEKLALAKWRNTLTGEAVAASAGSLAAADLLSELPVAILTPDQ